MITALIVVAAWTLLAILVGPIVGRCIRDGGHGDLSESQHPERRTERRAS